MILSVDLSEKCLKGLQFVSWVISFAKKKYDGRQILVSLPGVDRLYNE